MVVLLWALWSLPGSCVGHCGTEECFPYPPPKSTIQRPVRACLWCGALAPVSVFPEYTGAKPVQVAITNS